MRAILTNFGTMGDIQPFLALACELRHQGDNPVLAFSPNFASRIEELNLDFIPIGPDLRKVQNEINFAWTSDQEAHNSTEKMRSLLAPLMSFLPRAYKELRDGCRDAEVLISGPAQPASRMVYETTGIPFVSVQFSHFGGIGTLALQQASRSLINPFRSDLGLPPLQNPLTIDANSPQLALYAMSRHLLPQSSNWPAHYHMTGFFYLDEQWEPNPSLVDFIEDGEPPVVITFGSMTHSDPKVITNLIVEAIGMADCRAVIQQGWSGMGERELPPNIFIAGYVPHNWLFPRAACIVQHGGSGTAGAVFRSGIPSVFVPHMHLSDQSIFAELARELGCAGPVVHYGNLSATRLADAIKTVLTNRGYYEAAGALAEKIRAEEGTKRARQLIVELVSDIGPCRNEEIINVENGIHIQDLEEKRKRRKEYQLKQRYRRKDQQDRKRLIEG
jgi:sterol 3beta-glucosyltransferase